MDNVSNKYLKMSPLSAIAVLMGAFGLGLMASGVIAMAIGSAERPQLLTVSILQNVLAFVLPALVVGFMTARRPMQFLGMSENPGGQRMIIMVLIMAAMVPVINQTAQWNMAMHLPDSMASIESKMRNMEDDAAKVTEILLGDASVWGLVSGVLVVGVITGFSEELFFRGALQRVIGRWTNNKHVAIWTVAVIFSAMHFQFFGFIPRLLLGAVFGYFFAYSGSIWVSATAHAINNSLVVVFTWLEKNGMLHSSADNLGISEGFPWMAIMGAVFAIVMLQFYVRLNYVNKD